jgi:hypothetical protein
MHDDFLKLLEAVKSLVTYIDKEYVFDTAAAGGCSGMDYHLSDTFYDLIVDARKSISEVENGAKDSDTDGEASLRLFEATKALATYVEKERAFDKVNDMGPVGVETYQSETFIEVIQKANKAVKEVENSL